MEYGLIFTLYSTIFIVMLLITFTLKRKNKTIRVKIYTWCLICAFLFGLFELLTIYVKKYITPNDMIAMFNWKTRISCIIIFFYLYYCYCELLFETKEYKNINEVLFKTRKYQIALIVTIIAFVLAVFVLESEPIVIEDFVYIGGIIGKVLFSISFLLCAYSIIKAISISKEKGYILRTFIIITFIVLSLMLLQIYQPTISYTPSIVIIITFIIYFNIENPDVELAENIKLLREDIDTKGNSKIDFLFNLSEELIVPINKITSLSESLSNKTTYNKESIIRDIKKIKREGNYILDSTNNMLDVTMDNNNLCNVEYNIKNLIEKINENIFYKIDNKKIKFLISTDDKIKANFIGDVSKIEKILLNLLNNSVSNTEVGKIKLKLFAVDDKNFQYLNFIISDTGFGYKKEELEKLLTEKDSGIYLTKKLTKTLNGQFKVESKDKVGTTFHVQIPQIPIGSKTYFQELNESKEGTKNIDYSKYKILILDDDELDIKVTKKLLEKYKLQIETLNDPLKCIDKIKSEEEYDMIFIDYNMKEMNGIELIKVLKGLTEYKIPKLIMLTATSIDSMKENAIQSGFDDYLEKPINMKELDNIIKKHIV